MRRGFAESTDNALSNGSHFRPRSLYNVVRLQPNSEVQASVHGVLKLSLFESGYDWQFTSIPGFAFTDTGTGACH